MQAFDALILFVLVGCFQPASVLASTTTRLSRRRQQRRRCLIRLLNPRAFSRGACICPSDHDGLPILLHTAKVSQSFHTGVGQTISCPAVRTTSGWLDLFPLPCKKHTECGVMGNQHLCCKGFCTKGVPTAALKRPTAVASSSVDELSSSSSTSTSTTSTTTSTTTTTTTTTTPSTTSSTTTTTTTTTTTPKPTTTPEPPRPFLQLLPIQIGTTTKVNAEKIGKNQKLVCPKAPAPVVLFPIPCENNSQCRISSGPGEVCCDGRCVKGVPAPRPKTAEQSHQPILGVIPRECPAAPLGELLFEVQSCKTDSDCWPRVCCPDGTRSYCRTARARLDLVPVANRIEAPVRMFEQYLQCTPPPKFDAFPQRCSSSVDCFPNLCCAEGGKKHCRPPQRSLFSLLAGVTQRFG